MDIDIICVGNRIKARRKELNLSTNDIKRETGISTGALSDIENGKRTPSYVTFFLLAQALKCTSDWLISGVSPDPEKRVLTVSEEKLLSIFRQLSEYNQNEVLGIMELKLQNEQQDADSIRKKGKQMSNGVESSLSKPPDTTNESETA